MRTKALTFQFTLSGGDSCEKTFIATTTAIAWLKAARYVFCHAMHRVVGIRLVRQRQIVTADVNHKDLPPAVQPNLFLLTN